jgi:hypothetical protein
MQVMRLGGQVQSFSLAPGQELLATAHAGKKGIYLWANQFIYGGAADIMPSDLPVDISQPTMAAGSPTFSPRLLPFSKPRCCCFASI